MAGAWKVAYADFVTAMMAFFLLLWILNMVPPETKAGLAAYFSGERNMTTSSTSPVSNNAFIQNTDKINTQNIVINETQKSHIAIAQKLEEMIMADAVPQNARGISSDDVGVQLQVNSDVLFKPGSFQLSPKGREVLTSVKDFLDKYKLYLVVRGHADTSETRPPFTSPWELSAARSASAIAQLIEMGVKSTRLRGVCYGDTRPLTPGLDENSRAKNRRIEFFFHRPEVMNYSVVY